MNKRVAWGLGFCLVLIGVLQTAASRAETLSPEFSGSPDAVKSRMENVRRLVQSSSGAKRIMESTDAQAQAQRTQAIEYLKAAEAAFERDDMEAAQSALQHATETMFSAIRKIGTGKEGLDKRTRDFGNKAESVDVLLNAVERVATEKGGMPEVIPRARAESGKERTRHASLPTRAMWTRRV